MSLQEPDYPLKHEFYRTLDNYIEQAMLLRVCVETLLSMDAIKGEAANMLREQTNALRDASFGDDDEAR